MKSNRQPRFPAATTALLHRVDVHSFLVAAGVTLLAVALLFALPAPASSAGTPESIDAGQEQEKDEDKDKDKKKQTGRTVKATLLPTEPTESTEEEEGEEAEAEAEAEQSAAEESEESGSEDSNRETEPAESREAKEAESEPEPATSPRSASPATAEPEPTSSADQAAPASQPTAAADPPPTRPDVVRDRVVVREVLLDVLVNDKQGNPITGLGPDDFVVTERGERQEVTSATFYGAEEFEGSGVGDDVRTDRYFILMFHDQKQNFPRLTAAQLDAGRWTVRWLEENMLPNDQIAVVGYDSRLRLHQDFTRDRQKVAEAVLEAARGADPPDRWKTRSGPEFDPDSPQLFVNLPTGKALSKATPRLQHALELLGQAAEGIAGRKNLILYSLGFGETRGSFGGFVPDPRYYPPMEQSLNNGNVAVYTINTLGATRGGNTMAGITDSLSSISNDTGGHYYSNFLKVDTPLEQVSKENRAYYLISYTSEYDAGESGYREVEVDVTVDDARVTARRGYRFGTPNQK